MRRIAQPSKLIALFHQEGLLSAKDIEKSLKAHRATAVRYLNSLGDDIIQFGGGRSTRYGLKRNVRSLGNHWPIYLVDPEGKVDEFGTLHALEGGLWHVEFNKEQPSLVEEEFKNGIFPGLPWFLDDLRPQGFLGRALARRCAGEWGLPTSPEDWNEDQVLHALLSTGYDLPGNLIIGDDCLDAFYKQRAAITSISLADRKDLYPEFAEEVLRSGTIFFSAGGEQQKFTANIEYDKELIHPVIVKFSPPLNQPEGQRWADLLRAEYRAAKQLRLLDIPVADCEVHQFKDRVFLQASRFDRTFATGRRCVVSLSALDAAFFGMANLPWNKAADKLLSGSWITPDTSRQIQLLYWFGSFIGNTDMHFGNLSFFRSESKPWRMTPVYDMLPMLYRPGQSGEITAQQLQVPYPTPKETSLWTEALQAAVEYWHDIADSNDYSDEFKLISMNNANRLNQAVLNI